MRTIVHLSDIHFGRVDYAMVEPLIALISEIHPDLLAISGDVSQRARTSQFKEARAFLEKLPSPQVVVPGNHDIPLYNPLARFLRPLEKFRRYITEDLEPFYADTEIAVAGINTARSLTNKGGRINRRQVAAVVERFRALPVEIIKIIVTHHPFDLPVGHTKRDLVGRAPAAMKAFATIGADLFLAGHLHINQTSQTAERYKIAGHSALVVQAGTTLSTRARGEPNAFNVIRIQRPRISVQCYKWQPRSSTFIGGRAEEFSHSTSGWSA